MKPGNLRERKLVRKVLNPAVVYRKMRVHPNRNAPPTGGAFFTPKHLRPPAGTERKE